MTKRLLLLVTALFTLGYCQAPAPRGSSAPRGSAPRGSTLKLESKKAAPAPAPALIQKTESKPVVNELTVEQVAQLVQAGLSEDLIIAKIRKNGKAFDLSTEQLLQLKKARVSDNIIRILMDPQAQTITATPAIPVVPPASAVVPVTVPAPAQTQVKVKVPDGEKVRLLLMQDISSATAHEGDRIELSVVEDFKVGEDVVIAKGALAEGRITEVKKKRMLGQGGKLLMSIERVRAVDGQNLRLRATSGREGDDKIGKTVVVAVLAGPFALLVKGKDVVSPRGTEYTVYLDESREVLVLKNRTEAGI